MAEYKVTDTELTYLADKIRAKGGTEEALEWPTGFGEAVDDISSVGATLPIGYTQLDYLQSPVGSDQGDSNGAYINTGIKANQDTRMILDVSLGSGFWIGIAGIIEGDSNRFGMIYFKTSSQGNNANTIRTFFGAETLANTPVPSTTNTESYVRCEIGKTMRLNGTSITHSDATFQTNDNIYLFGMNDASTGNPGWNASQRTIFRCKIYDNNTLIADLIPCINPDNIIGMYDVVRRYFIPKSGTRVFNYYIPYNWED